MGGLRRGGLPCAGAATLWREVAAIKVVVRRLSSSGEYSAGVEGPSREAAFLSDAEAWCGRMIWGGPPAFALGVLLLDQASGGALRIIGGMGAFGGIPLFLSGLWWRRTLARARMALREPPQPTRLEVQVRRGYAGIPYTSAQLWPIEGGERPVAQFGTNRCKPRTVGVDREPAQMYGIPTKRSVVVVSSQSSVIVGRIKRSHYGDDSPPREFSPFVRAIVTFLLKPRRLW